LEQEIELFPKELLSTILGGITFPNWNALITYIVQNGVTPEIANTHWTMTDAGSLTHLDIVQHNGSWGFWATEGSAGQTPGTPDSIDASVNSTWVSLQNAQTWQQNYTAQSGAASGGYNDKYTGNTTSTFEEGEVITDYNYGSITEVSFDYTPNGMCLFDGISYIARNFGGFGNPGYNSNFFFNDFTSRYGSSTVQYNSSGQMLGVQANSTIVQSFLNQWGISSQIFTNGTQVNNHLNNGGQVFTVISSTGPNGENLTHAIILQSTTNSRGYNVLDTSTGEQYEIANSQVNSTTLLGI